MSDHAEAKRRDPKMKTSSISSLELAATSLVDGLLGLSSPTEDRSYDQRPTPSSTSEGPQSGDHGFSKVLPKAHVST